MSRIKKASEDSSQTETKLGPIKVISIINNLNLILKLYSG